MNNDFIYDLFANGYDFIDIYGAYGDIIDYRVVADDVDDNKDNNANNNNH